MTIYEIVETFIRAANGGNYSSDMKWDFPYIESFIPQTREQAMRIMYNGSRTQAANKTIFPDWVQSNTYTNFTKVSNPYEATYLVTDALPIVIFNDIQTGVTYTGTAGGTHQFKEARSKGEIATWYGQRIFERGNIVGVLRVGDKLEIHGNPLLKSLSEEAVYQNPTKVSNFNYDTTRYPINEDLIRIMKELFLQQVKFELMIPKDTTADRTASK